MSIGIWKSYSVYLEKDAGKKKNKPSMSGRLYRMREWENGMDGDISRNSNSNQMSFYKFSS